MNSSTFNHRVLRVARGRMKAAQTAGESLRRRGVSYAAMADAIGVAVASVWRVMQENADLTRRYLPLARPLVVDGKVLKASPASRRVVGLLPAVHARHVIRTLDFKDAPATADEAEYVSITETARSLALLPPAEALGPGGLLLLMSRALRLPGEGKRVGPGALANLSLHLHPVLLNPLARNCPAPVLSAARECVARGLRHAEEQWAAHPVIDHVRNYAGLDLVLLDALLARPHDGQGTAALARSLDRADQIEDDQFFANLAEATAADPTDENLARLAACGDPDGGLAPDRLVQLAFVSDRARSVAQRVFAKLVLPVLVVSLGVLGAAAAAPPGQTAGGREVERPTKDKAVPALLAGGREVERTT